MSIAQDLFGVSYNIPETRAKKWGATVTAALINLMKAVDGALYLDGSDVAFLLFTPATGALAASATLTPTNMWHRISGSGGAVTLDTTTAIADGANDGQLLILSGTDGTNTVTIEHNSNVTLNGDVTLGLSDFIVFLWDDTLSDWQELFRSN